MGSTSGLRPYGLAFGSDGDLYVADLRNQIARVSLDGGITTVVPEPTGLNTPLFLVAIVPEPGCWQLATTAAAMLTCVRVLSRRKR